MALQKIIILLLFGYTSANILNFLPNGCPEDFSVHYLLPHEYDCAKFYSCSNGRRIEINCAPGTLFDYGIQSCNHADAVECILSSTTTIKSTDSVHSTTEILSSVAPNESTTESVIENEPGNTTDNVSATLVTEELDSSTKDLESTTHTPNDPTTDNLATNEPDEKHFLPNGCPKDFSIHYLLPHEYDCAKFYSCSNGRRIEITCAPGTLFDYKLQGCNWPHVVDCYLQTTTTSEPTTSAIIDDNTSSDVTHPGLTTENPATEASTEFAESTNSPTTELKTESSTINDAATRSTFSPSTELDEENKGTTVEVSTKETVATEHPTTVQSETSKSLTDTTAAVEVTTESSVITAGTTKDPNETDTTSKPTTTEEPAPTDLETTTIEVSTLKSTTDNIYTEENDVTVSTPVYLTTEETSTANPTTEESPICPDGVTGNIRHPDRCDAYIWCPFGIEFTCVDGFEFDPLLGRCTVIAPGGCTYVKDIVEDATEKFTTEITSDLPTTTEETTTELTTQEIHVTEATATEALDVGSTTEVKLTESTTSDDYTSEQPSELEVTTLSPTTNEVETAEPTTEPPSVCPEGETGNVRDPDRCDGYFWCPFGIHFTCPEGFEFSPEKRECVTIELGGCTSIELIIQETTTTGFTTESLGTEDWTTTTETNTVDVSQSTPENFAPEEITTIESDVAEASPTEKPVCADGQTGNVAHLSKCNVYYWCPFGIQFTCPEGFEFNSRYQNCTLIAPGGCTSNSTTIAETTTTELNTETTTTTSEESSIVELTTLGGFGVDSDSDVTTADPTAVEPTTEEPSTTESPPCADGQTGNVAHPSRCDAYYWCPFGVQFTCPEGFEFDPELRACTELSLGGCTLSRRRSNSIHPICDDTNEFSLHPDQFVCDIFYVCVGGAPVKFNCDYGKQFDKETKTCAHIKRDNCTVSL